MTIVYTAEVLSSGDGRNGRARSSDGILDLSLTSPKELGGAGTATNPEQLFAAGYAACFHSALRLVAREANVALKGESVSSLVSLNKDKNGFHLSVAISVEIPGSDKEQARLLVAQAHGRCPYSKAIEGNVDVQVSITS